ncbi:MAG: 2TM domain-containing protein [Spirochaetales bacterium]|nr:2TM domain-containing protein [Spirochaetales bacterium]
MYPDKEKNRSFSPEVFDRGKTSPTFFENLKKKILKKVRGAVTGFSAHAVVFGAANAFLFVLNMLTSAQFPWFYFPLGAWGIGLASHFQYVLNAKKARNQILPLEKLDPEQLVMVRKIQKMEGAFNHHRTAFLAFSAFICGINNITWGGFQWWLIPTAAWGVGFLVHFAVHRARKKYLIEELKEAGIVWEEIKKHRFTPKYGDFSPRGGGSGVLKQAEAIKNSLIGQVKTDREMKRHFGGELEQLLSRFIGQIEELLLRDTELDRVLTTVSEEEIGETLASLKTKYENTDAAYLKKEYEKSISQYEHHRKTITELKNQKEMISLRLSSSITALKQIQLDVARMKHMDTIQEPYSLKTLKAKSRELSDYLEALQESYRELDLGG